MFFHTIINSNLVGVVNGITLVEQNQKIGDNKIASKYKTTVMEVQEFLYI